MNDLSYLPALVGAFVFSPIAGLMIELVKNILQLMTSSTGGIGELDVVLYNAFLLMC